MPGLLPQPSPTPWPSAFAWHGLPFPPSAIQLPDASSALAVVRTFILVQINLPPFQRGPSEASVAHAGSQCGALELWGDQGGGQGS